MPLDAPPKPRTHNLFEVFLRLRPPPPGAPQTERILDVETPAPPKDQPEDAPKPIASQITLNPPPDRRRAIEKFAFTQVLEEEASQVDVFSSTEIASMVEGVLAPKGGDGTDAVVATLGVTGSGKTHTILGSKTQRGLTQLAMDVLFRSIGPNMLETTALPSTLDSLQSCDASEGSLSPASQYLETVFAPENHLLMSRSRAATPINADFRDSVMSTAAGGPRRNLPMPTNLPIRPDISDITVSCDAAGEYVIVVSMYEVHNDRIYDLLTPAVKNAATKEYRRRPLLFKSTELSPDRKVVAGLRKVVCPTYKEALLVVEAGLHERRVTGTGSNSVSSRSHGFFVFEVKKRTHATRRGSAWGGSKLTIVDLAGSERASQSKTAGATLVEAGKINESLMYLGQCLQTQSEVGSSSKPNVVPYRQCKLTELLFSNSFPSTAYPNAPRRNPQKGVMIVTADPVGDFNATSQILRYSALAREVTVPRVPSITTTLLTNPPPTGNPRSISPIHPQSRPFVPPGAAPSTGTRILTPLNMDDRTTMEIAALEIARMSDEIDLLRCDLDEESNARMTAEAHLLSMEDRLLDLEAAIREECAMEYEQRLMLEVARFKASMAVEQERIEEHWDKKVDLIEMGLDGGVSMDENEGDKENVLIEDLSQEVERLRRENGVLKRELAGRSPSKRRPLEERDDFTASEGGSVSNLGRKLERMKVGAPGSAAQRTERSASPKKVRRVGGKD